MVMHIDDIKALAKSAHNEAEVRERLFRTMLSGEGKEASNAAKGAVRQRLLAAMTIS